MDVTVSLPYLIIKNEVIDTFSNIEMKMAIGEPKKRSISLGYYL
jgi:hypothetical protein